MPQEGFVPGAIENDVFVDFVADQIDAVQRHNSAEARYNILMENVNSGFYVGISIVDGVNCHHLAYRDDEVDWQIWIEDGDKPLPKKFVITTKWLTGAPQYTVSVKSWDLSPKLKDDMFTFVPPKDAKKIEFVRYTN